MTPAEQHDEETKAIVSIVFFLSGAAALLYQIVWQRTLFSLYGVNIESVTVIVTVFMVGLGLGSVVGGLVSRDPARPTMRIFALFELSIALFGVFSLRIFHTVGAATLGASPAAVAALSFALLLLPTSLMGATLPLLIAHFTRISKSVGASMGSLYYVNTMGSAVASAASVLLLLPRLGQEGTVRAAAALNVIVALSAAWVSRRTPPASASASASKREGGS